MRHKNPEYDFSRSPERSISPNRQHNLGPGAYEAIDSNIAGHTSLVYSIPKGDKREDISDTPGPGHYKIPVKFADIPSYSKPG